MTERLALANGRRGAVRAYGRGSSGRQSRAVSGRSPRLCRARKIDSLRPSAGPDNILVLDAPSKRPFRVSIEPHPSAKITAMPSARPARASDLSSLLALFEVSEVSAAAQPRERADGIWQETLVHPGVHVFVSDDRDRIAATCMLIIAPNLLRSGRRHGFLENVVTHPRATRPRSWQGRGAGCTETCMGG